MVISRIRICPFHLKNLLKCYLRFCGTAITLKLRMMQNENFSNKKLNVLSQLIENGRITSWVNLKDEYE